VTTTGSATIAPSRPPRRSELARATVTVLVRGGLGKADVLAVELSSGPMIVKDFARSAWWLRWLGVLQIAREARAYGHLEGVAGIPRFYGKIDRLALALEKIEGERLAFVKLPGLEGEKYLRKLRRIVDAIHERGVVHNDLRGRENVILGRDGELRVIDFAGALHLSPGGLLHRFLFRRLATTDEAAFLKWKGMLAPGTYTDADRAFLARFERLRALWPFNPKRGRARVSA
jgi:serine/threonine protein kinase